MAVDRRAHNRADQQALFEDERRQPGYEHPPMSGRQLLPENWMKRSDVVFHSSWSPSLPEEDEDHPTMSQGSGHGSDNWDTTGLHYGTEKSAHDRREDGYIHPARILHNAIAPPTNPYLVDEDTRDINDNGVWQDNLANSTAHAADAVGRGRAVAYANAFEDEGSTSYRAPDAARRTWDDDVAGADRPEFDRLVGMRSPVGRDWARVTPNPFMHDDGGQQQMFPYRVGPRMPGDTKHRGGEYLDRADADEAQKRIAMGHNPPVGFRVEQNWAPALAGGREQLSSGQFRLNKDSQVNWKLQDPTDLADITPAYVLSRHDDQD